MTKRLATSITKTKSTSDRLEFGKIINGVTAKQDAFTKAVELMKEFSIDKLNSLAMEMDDKNRELEELSKQVERKRKDSQIETDQMLAEYKYEGAKSILSEVNEEPIKSSKLVKLLEEVETLNKGNKEELEKVLKDERHSAKRTLEMVVSNKSLEHKAEVAELTATNRQLTNEIESLHKSMDNLKDEISAQRELTKSIAQASARGAISQNFGKQ